MHRVTQHRSKLDGVEARTIFSDRSFPRHSHDQLGIGVVVKGGHRSWSGIGIVEAGPGDSIMVNPGEMHDGMPQGRTARAWRMLYFDPDLVRRTARTEGVVDIEMVRPAVRDPVLVRNFVRLFQRVTAADSEPLAVEEGLVMVLMCALRHHGLRPPAQREPWPTVKVARERIDADPAAPVTLVELARLAGVTQFQLIRRFARDVGATPHAYIVQRRVLVAQGLLIAGHSIADAAVAAGFADQSHLTRAFARQFGVTPGSYAAAVA